MLRVAIALVGIIVVARLVPLAIRAIGGAGRGTVQMFGGLGQPLWWIAGTGGAVLVLLMLRWHGRRRLKRRQGPPSSLN